MNMNAHKQKFKADVGSQIPDWDQKTQGDNTEKEERKRQERKRRKQEKKETKQKKKIKSIEN